MAPSYDRPRAFDRPAVIRLEGAWNFRDLGGNTTSSGRVVAYGRVYRSSSLDGLTEGDIRTITEAGFRTMYDLRRESERDRLPVRLAPSTDCVHLPMGSDNGNWHGGALAATATASSYWRLAERHIDAIRAILSGLADGRRLPAVIYCNAGKDRTGVVSAILLSLLGVPQNAVLDDFERSETLWHATQAEIRPLPEPAREHVAVRRSAMGDFLSRVTETYGSFKLWLAADSEDAVRCLRRLENSLLVHAG